MTAPTKEAFEDALELLITGCEQPQGLHAADMIGPLKARLAECRENALSSCRQHGHGHPLMTEAQIRELLQLEPYEPLPRQISKLKGH
jgi:hypothetical protein